MKKNLTGITFEIPLQRKFFAMLTILLALLVVPSVGQISWPADQLLPSFPATVQKLDFFYLKGEASELYLFSSLKGLVNRKSPRLFSYEGDEYAEGPFTWLQSLNLEWVEQDDKWSLITKYRSEISGLIVYDPNRIHTVNLATMLAKDKKALIASPSLLSRLTAAPYNLPVLMDLRGKFSSKLEVYRTMYDKYWPDVDHRLLIGLNPERHQAGLREYATALGTAVIWLDPEVSDESELLNRYLFDMPAGSNIMGWWPEEGPGVTRASQYGIGTIASDYSSNLTVHSGMPRTITIKPIPPKPKLQNYIYVAFILADGDNLQYVEHLVRKLWKNPDRGSVPIGWTLSPAMVDAMPGALNFFHQTATDNDNLISGPSGYGYVYPNFFPDQGTLDKFVAKTEDYNRRAGFRVITIWNTITGGINQNVGQSFAAYAPSTLGLTGQNTGGPLTIYSKKLPGKPLSCNYCTNEQAMKDHIRSASEGWEGKEPRFLLIQAQPWQDVKPTDFKNVANSLNKNYRVVRPDHLFMLLRESLSLPINPDPGLMSGIGSDQPCSGSTQYHDNGGYAAGAIVRNGGSCYQCKFYPDSRLCNGDAWAYEPGAGVCWQKAWTRIGTCSTGWEPANLISPNPVANSVTINYNETTHVKVYNLLGNEVIADSEVHPNGNLDVSTLSPGMYLIKINSGSKTTIQKLLKN